MTNVCFVIDGAITGHTQREVSVVPRIGEQVAWHAGQNQSMKYVVSQVTHVYEDREWYKERTEMFGDRVYVTLRSIEQDEGVVT